MASTRNWVDRARILFRVGNRMEAFELRRFGISPMSLLNKGEVLLLETTGRRSGKTRYTPLGYWQEPSGSYVIGGGAGGKTTTPDWVANLRASGAAAVWIKRRRRPVSAIELVGAERDGAQSEATRIWPGVPSYARRSGRVIPYFRLTPN